jgi:hypothetical protein
LRTLVPVAAVVPVAEDAIGVAAAAVPLPTALDDDPAC